MLLFVFNFKHLIMSKRIRLSVSSAEEWEADWLKCFYESLILPDKKANPKAGSGLSPLPINILQFHMINEVPIALDIRRIDDGDGLDIMNPVN